MRPIVDYNTVATGRDPIHGLTRSRQLRVGVGVARTIWRSAELLYGMATRFSLSRLFTIPSEIGDGAIPDFLVAPCRCPKANVQYNQEEDNAYRGQPENVSKGLADRHAGTHIAQTQPKRSSGQPSFADTTPEPNLKVASD